MKTAKEMKDFSDQNYLVRYNGYWEEIVQKIEEMASQGFYHATWILNKDYCPDWTKTPLREYVAELENLGYDVAVSDIDAGFCGMKTEFEISWR